MHKQLPATDPHHTQELWHSVRQRKVMSSTMPPCSLRPRPASKLPRRITLSDSRACESPTASLSADDSATAGSRTSEKVPRDVPRVTDKNFCTVVLPAYRIDVSTGFVGRQLDGPYAHFGTTAVPPGPPGLNKEEIVSWYRREHKQEDSTIWLQLDNENTEMVALQYQLMVVAGEQAAKFAFYGKIAFLCQDLTLVSASMRRTRTAYYKMEWAPQPDPEKHLHCPPLQNDDQSKPFPFENKPDLAFWLPIGMFKRRNRQLVKDVFHVVPKAQVTAPYFTVEFKKDGEDLEAAVNQLAASAALALYNRVRLRARRHHSFNFRGAWQSAQFDDLVHYGIAFAADVAYVYKAVPQIRQSDSGSEDDLETSLAQVWAGCTLNLLLEIRIETPEDVVELRGWINEIQNWELRKYAGAFMLDVKGIMQADEYVKSTISMTEEEVRSLGLAEIDSASRSVSEKEASTSG